MVVVHREKCREEARCGIMKEGNLAFGERVSPCKIACPIHLDVPGYIALISKGRHKEALDLIRQKMPLPATMGRICSHPCEAECLRREIDEPLAIAALRRHVVDPSIERLPDPVPRGEAEEVAIIGSGPAGLAAAYDLVRNGYGVTIFEALPVPGGMLAVGIPEYRLPKAVVQREIDYVKALGVEIRLNTPIGPQLTLNDLVQQGYAATFIAVGAHGSGIPPVPGSELEGTVTGVSLLRDVNMGRGVTVGRKVIVLGGGNVAFDCARTALRLGARKVSLACPECREKMPADSHEIEEGEEEGIDVKPSCVCTGILGKNGRVAGVECVGVERMGFNEKGELCFERARSSEHVLEADTVVFAIGQSVDLGVLFAAEDIQVTKRGTIAINPETMETSRPGVFAGGDAAAEPAKAIDAIAAGQRAAASIVQYLRGEVIRGKAKNQTVDAGSSEVEMPANILKEKRQSMAVLPVGLRTTNFREVHVGLNEEMANAEARRCLNCAGHLCKDVCPYSAPQFGAEDNAKMQMCTFCLDRLVDGKSPICVGACPVRALDFGPMGDLEAKYGSAGNAVGFAYSDTTRPSILFKPKIRQSARECHGSGKEVQSHR